MSLDLVEVDLCCGFANRLTISAIPWQLNCGELVILAEAAQVELRDRVMTPSNRHPGLPLCILAYITPSKGLV
jgi:hypothetical protein